MKEAYLIDPSLITSRFDGEGSVKVFFQSEKLLFAQFELLPGASLSEDVHMDGDEGYYVLEGECTVELESHTIQKVRAGQVFFIPAGVKHTARNRGNQKIVVIAAIAPRT